MKWISDIDFSGAGNIVRKAWDSLSPLPFGKVAFSKFIGQMAPYTGTLDARVEELRKGYGKVVLQDRRAVRNHLRSVHAIALMNLAEIVGGLTMLYGMPDDARGILSRLTIDYLKKGRGELIAECNVDLPTTNERKEYDIVAEIRDQSDDLVARAKARWLIGPKV